MHSQKNISLAFHSLSVGLLRVHGATRVARQVGRRPGAAQRAPADPSTEPSEAERRSSDQRRADLGALRFALCSESRLGRSRFCPSLLSQHSLHSSEFAFQSDLGCSSSSQCARHGAAVRLAETLSDTHVRNLLQVSSAIGTSLCDSEMRRRSSSAAAAAALTWILLQICVVKGTLAFYEVFYATIKE